MCTTSKQSSVTPCQICGACDLDRRHRDGSAALTYCGDCLENGSVAVEAGEGNDAAAQFIRAEAMAEAGERVDIAADVVRECRENLVAVVQLVGGGTLSATEIDEMACELADAVQGYAEAKKAHRALAAKFGGAL